MPSKSKDALFLLVKSLNSNEKRQLKLLVKRNANSEDVNTLHIFDALDKMADYDEVLLLRKVPSVKKATTFQYQSAIVQANYGYFTFLTG